MLKVIRPWIRRPGSTCTRVYLRWDVTGDQLMAKVYIDFKEHMITNVDVYILKDEVVWGPLRTPPGLKMRSDKDALRFVSTHLRSLDYYLL